MLYPSWQREAIGDGSGGSSAVYRPGPGGLQILSNEEGKFLFCFCVKPGPQDYGVVTWEAA